VAWKGDKNLQQLQVLRAASSARVAGQLLVEVQACLQELAAAAAQLLVLQVETRSSSSETCQRQAYPRLQSQFEDELLPLRHQFLPEHEQPMHGDHLAATCTTQREMCNMI